MQEKTPTVWAETSTTEITNGTRTHAPISNTPISGRNSNFYDTLYRPQHVDKQMKVVFIGELQFGRSRVPNGSSVLLNGNTNLKQFWHWSARVPIQLRVQQNSYEQKLSIEHEIPSPNYACTASLRWTNETKVTNSTRAFNQLCNGEKWIYWTRTEESTKVFWMKSYEF